MENLRVDPTLLSSWTREEVKKERLKGNITCDDLSVRLNNIAGISIINTPDLRTAVEHIESSPVPFQEGTDKRTLHRKGNSSSVYYPFESQRRILEAHIARKESQPGREQRKIDRLKEAMVVWEQQHGSRN